MIDNHKRKASSSISLNINQTPPNTVSDDQEVESEMTMGGFTKVLTKDEKRKLRKVEKHRPQFQFDISHFRQGKKIGIAVSLPSCI